jgi:translation initiation factor IF-3
LCILAIWCVLAVLVLLVCTWRGAIVLKTRDMLGDKAKEDTLRINGGIIGVPEVRLINSSGDVVGIVSIAEALDAARKEDLDLVEISPKVDPPVCKIMNCGKYVYEQQKKKQEAKKKRKIIEIKEIQLRPVIDKHDLEVKLKAAEKFLGHGNKVKFVMRFRGREFSHQDLGLEFLERVIDRLSEFAKAEIPPKLDGKQYTVVLAPIK